MHRYDQLLVQSFGLSLKGTTHALGPVPFSRTQQTSARSFHSWTVASMADTCTERAMLSAPSEAPWCRRYCVVVLLEGDMYHAIVEGIECLRPAQHQLSRQKT